ncbi:hypothetical protein [Streptomyces griseoflavus]|uniref:hypothetical protein n=1 Tax=Streptomyces griseoflavus TaxID=35619 RepID=UPI00131A4005|nr:hypothetical protein [Streptomyces griseoflavus]
MVTIGVLALRAAFPPLSLTVAVIALGMAYKLARHGLSPSVSSGEITLCFRKSSPKMPLGLVFLRGFKIRSFIQSVMVVHRETPHRISVRGFS